MKKVRNIVLILIFLTVLSVIIFWPGVLGISLNNRYSFPLGTLISWAGLIAFTLFFYLVFPKQRQIRMAFIFKNFLLFNFFLSLFWGIISFVFAGNWSFSFQNNSMFVVWIILTLVIIFFPPLLYLLWFMLRIFSKKSI